MATKLRDRDIRERLRSTELAVYRSDPLSRVVEELGIDFGQFRVDISVINGHLHGYEIKSEADDLSRLPAQAAAYNRVFDWMSVVVHENHLPEIEKMECLATWRVLLVTGTLSTGFCVAEHRVGAQNEQIDPVAVASLLWKDELIAELDAVGMVRGYRSKKRIDLARRFAEVFPRAELSQRVRQTLKQRQGWRAD